MIEIKESTYDDIKNIQGLWADADVMKYIWPGGLQETEEAFKNGAETVWVDPNPANSKAIALYQRLGFVRKEMPEHVIALGEDPNVFAYMETRIWKSIKRCLVKNDNSDRTAN